MTTTNLAITLPTDGADANVWGAELNTALTRIDLAFTPATRQKLTSGTAATYTPPANCRFIRVTIKGPGGGSAGTGTSTQTAGGDGGDASFGGVIAKGGKGSATTGVGGQGGTGGSDNSKIVYREPGSPGGSACCGIWSTTDFFTLGGHGGGKGGGSAAISGTSPAPVAGVANSGGGASGGGTVHDTQTNISTYSSSGGGGEGEKAIFWLPATTYTYTVPAGGAAGVTGLGASAQPGAAGGSGVIDVEEFY